MNAPVETVAALLAEGRSAGVERLDAQLLVACRMGRSRTWILGHEDEGVDRAIAALVRADLAERARGVPLAYIVGTREFYGLTLQVTPAVLVPRPETETLVDWALELLGGAAVDVVDLGTGSGAIALAVKSQRPAARMTATDASAAALGIAGLNASRLGLAVEFVHGRWWDPLPGRRFDLALCNPPYIDAADPHLAALHAEPHEALTPGTDGLAALRDVVAGASEHLRPGAPLLLEHGEGQGSRVRTLLAHNGFTDILTRVDLAGRERVTAGRNRVKASGVATEQDLTTPLI